MKAEQHIINNKNNVCQEFYMNFNIHYYFDIQNKPMMAYKSHLILQIGEWSFKDIKKIAKFSYLFSERLGFKLRSD